MVGFGETNLTLKIVSNNQPGTYWIKKVEVVEKTNSGERVIMSENFNSITEQVVKKCPFDGSGMEGVLRGDPWDYTTVSNNQWGSAWGSSVRLFALPGDENAICISSTVNKDEDKNGISDKITNVIKKLLPDSKLEKIESEFKSKIEKEVIKPQEPVKTSSGSPFEKIQTVITPRGESISISMEPTVEKKQNCFLVFSGKIFTRISEPAESGIRMILDEKEKKWLLYFDEDTQLIDQRTAERQARSISKAGFGTETGERLGIGYELKIIGEKDVPPRLLKDQHEY